MLVGLCETEILHKLCFHRSELVENLSSQVAAVQVDWLDLLRGTRGESESPDSGWTRLARSIQTGKLRSDHRELGNTQVDSVSGGGG